MFSKLGDTWSRLSFGAMSYAVGASIVVLSHQPGRVPCHLQDPIKAVIIIFSLLYYFFFCKKMLGLRKLFAAAVLSVGLFIAADYGLCDEFKCRGSPYHSEGSWELRAFWTILYLVGLALFTFHFTIAEEHIANRISGAVNFTLANSFLDTVSRLVAQSEEVPPANEQHVTIDATVLNQVNGSPRIVVPVIVPSKKICIMTTLWIQGITWFFLAITGLLVMTMTYSLNFYVSSASLLNFTVYGLECHKPYMEWTPHPSVNTLPNFVNVDVEPDIPVQYLNPFDESVKTNIYAFSKKHTSPPPEHDFNVGKRMEHIRRMLDADRGRHSQKNQKHVWHGPKNKINDRENSTSTMGLQRLKEKMFKDSTYKGNEYNLYNLTKRFRRSMVESYPYGFKVIHPTISILKDHTITTKMKHYLIGHKILNLSDANIKGHKIKAETKQDSILHLNKWKYKSEHDKLKQHKSVNTEKKPLKIKSQRIKRFVGDDVPKTGAESNYKQEKLNKTLAKVNSGGRYRNVVDANVVYEITTHDTVNCMYVSNYGWIVYVSYTTYAISSIRFLKLCQSSVFTIAMMTPALPLTGVWWALFTHSPDGTLVIQPNLSGELICALLSLPIVVLGLLLLFRAQLYQPMCSTLDEERSEDYFVVMQHGMDPKVQGEHSNEFELQGIHEMVTI